MFRLNHKVKGSSMIESIVAVSILMSILIIAFAIITQSYKSDNLMIKTQSVLVLQNEICDISLYKEHINKSTEAGIFSIHYTFNDLPESELICLKYEVKINEITWKHGEQYFTQKN